MVEIVDTRSVDRPPQRTLHRNNPRRRAATTKRLDRRSDRIPCIMRDPVLFCLIVMTKLTVKVKLTDTVGESLSCDVDRVTHAVL